MSIGVNLQIIVGNLGQDARIEEVDGRAVANFSVAVNSSFTKKDGTRVDQTEWFNVALWGKIATALGPYLRKGTQIYVEGPTRSRVQETEHGRVKHTRIDASTVKLLGGGDRRGPDTQAGNEYGGQEQGGAFDPFAEQ